MKMRRAAIGDSIDVRNRASFQDRLGNTNFFASFIAHPLTIRLIANGQSGTHLHLRHALTDGEARLATAVIIDGANE
jgi:hypothetical protein